MKRGGCVSVATQYVLTVYLGPAPSRVFCSKADRKKKCAPWPGQRFPRNLARKRFVCCVRRLFFVRGRVSAIRVSSASCSSFGVTHIRPGVIAHFGDGRGIEPSQFLRAPQRAARGAISTATSAALFERRIVRETHRDWRSEFRGKTVTASVYPPRGT